MERWRLNRLRKSVIIDKGIEIDEEEDKPYGDKNGDELPPELNTREKIRKKIEEIKKARDKKLKRSAKNLIEQYAVGDDNQKKIVLDKLDKAENEINKSGQKAVSLTDPESRFMKTQQHTKCRNWFGIYFGFTRSFDSLSY